MLNFKPFAIPKYKRALAALDEMVYEFEFGVRNLEAPTLVLKEIVAAGQKLEARTLLRAVKLFLAKRLDVYWGIVREI